MNEKEVKRRVKEDLRKKYDFVREEFTISGGRVDFAAFRWEDQYRIDSIAVECKGEIKYPKSIYDLLSEQLAGYLKAFPKVYLASPKPRSEVLDTIKVLCRLNYLGYITVGEGVDYALPIEDPFTPVFDNNEYLRAVRGRAVMFLTFQEIFGKVLRLGPSWCSTPEPNDQAQYNAFQWEEACRLGINIQDARRIINRLDVKRLHEMLKQETPKVQLEVWHEKYFGPGRSRGIMLVQKQGEEISLENLRYIKEKAREGMLLHIGINMPVWRVDEVLSRDEHKIRMELIRESLNPLHDYLSR